MWQILIIFYFIFGAASYLLRRVLAQRLGEHNRLINSVFFLFFLLPAGAVLYFFLPGNLNVGVANIALLLGGSLIFPVANIAAFHANKKVDVGIFTIINNLSPLFTLAIALPFLHESLRAPQFFGAGLLIVSGVLAAAAQFNKKNRSSIDGVLMCLLATGILGVAFAYERFMLNRVDFGAYLVYGWGAQIVWALILARKEFKNLPQLFSKHTGARKIVFFWGLASVLKSAAFISALRLSTASVISSASNFLSVVVVVAAFFFLKERKHIIHKILAVAVGLAGLLFIAG